MMPPWYHIVRQHSKLPRQQTVATASKHRQTKGGHHDGGRLYPQWPPLLPIDIENQQQCCLLSLAAL